MPGGFRLALAPIVCLSFVLIAPAAPRGAEQARPLRSVGGASVGAELAPPRSAQDEGAKSRDATASRAREEAVRERAEKIPEMLALAGITTGSRVADVGAGTGFLTVRLARLVGPGGRVYAEDVQPRALEVLRKRVREERLDNVEIIQGTADDPKLPSDSLDAILILMAFHEMSDPASMLAHMRAALRPAGRLVMVEPTSRSVAPDRAAQREADVLSAQLAEDDLRKAGFQIAELRDPFVTQLAGHSLHWLIVAHRSPGILLSPILRPEARVTSDVRRVIPSPPGNGNITGADLRLSVDDAKKQVEARSAVIVDLRADAEYRAGHLPGAISILQGEFDARTPELLARGKPIVLYCG